MIRKDIEPVLLLTVALLALVLSGIRPYDRLTWFLEVFPVLLGIPVLVFTFRRFPLTSLLYRLLLIHAIILIVGGYYTYARVPLGYFFQDMFDLSRNHYDRLGHLAQGFIPAILAREILLRRSPLVRGKWLFFLVTCICLAFSAFYEMIEWWAAVLGGDTADSFLGSQGDIWDSHWDMFFALIGAMTSQVLLSGWHDRDLGQLTETSSA